MNYLDVKRILLPIEEGINTAQRLLSEKEARNNLRLLHPMSKIRIHVAELKGILQRLKRAEIKEKNL